jgi:hypothetical protein
VSAPLIGFNTRKADAAEMCANCQCLSLNPCFSLKRTVLLEQQQPATVWQSRTRESRLTQSHTKYVSALQLRILTEARVERLSV